MVNQRKKDGQQMDQPYLVAVAGSTSRTVLCAQSLLQDKRFELGWLMTSQPKIRGKQKVPTPTPLHQFAEKQQLTSILVNNKIDDSIKNQITAQPKPDFLLIVDFGYLVPKWLLKYTRIYPLNIHPSDLPRWRGSSPAQFAILYGEKNSAISLMVPNEKLDQGDLITKLPFEVLPTWNQGDYYDFAFALIQNKLPDLLDLLAQGQLSPIPQPDQSPTMTARQLNRADGFVNWQVLSQIINGQRVKCAELGPEQMSSLLVTARAAHSSCAAMLEHACRALYPWPGLWTKIPTPHAELRMKILSCHLDQDVPLQLVLDDVQIEGKNPARWAECKNIVVQK